MSKSLLCFAFLILSITTSRAQQSSWSEVGTEINGIHANGNIRALTSDASGNIYAAGDFIGGTPMGYYVAKWNGTSWSELGAGANVLNENLIGTILTLACDASGNIYAAGDFADATNKQFVAKWNGTSWSELGTGNNALNANDEINKIVVDASGNIYAAGNFKNNSNKEYVAKWNGTSWSELGMGANALSADGTIETLAIDPSGNVYAAGMFTDASSNFYVAKWNGSSWSELGTGANALNAPTPVSYIEALATDASGNVYTTGYFEDGTGGEYVAKWNGTSWSELGTGSNALNAVGGVFTLTVDASGNVYTAGNFIDGTGHCYVAKWNGSSWSEVGTGTNALNANNAIYALLLNPSKIYAAGHFTNGLETNYVAEYALPCNSISAGTIANTSNALCGPGVDTLTLEGTFGNGVTCQWQSSTNGTAWTNTGADTIIYTTGALAGTTYYRTIVTCTAAGLADTSNADMIAVYPLPAPVIITNLPELATSPFSTYQWNLNGVPITGATNQEYTTTQNGVYSVTVTNANGCSETSATATVGNLGDPIITTGITGAKLYPNPNRGTFAIECTVNGSKDVQVEVLNAIGQLVYQATIPVQNEHIKEQLVLPGENADGIYLMRLKTDKGSSITQFTTGR